MAKKLTIMRPSGHACGGDQTLEWTTDEERESVEAEFNKIIAEGFMASKVTGPGTLEQIREFDPDADEILLSAPLVGG